MSEEIFDVEEAAKYLHLNDQTVRAMARQGKLPAFKIGRSWRFRKQDLFQIDSTRPSSPTPKESTVLVIDDDQLVHYLIEASVKGFNVNIEKAFDGESGLEIARSKDIDFVFLDLSMPGMNGPEVLKVLRSVKGGIPVAIITSFPESELMEEAMKYSPVILLAKPFSSEQVIECLEGLTLTSSAVEVF